MDSKTVSFILILLLAYSLESYSQWETEYRSVWGRSLKEISVVDSNIAWAVGRIGLYEDTSFVIQRVAPYMWNEFINEFMVDNRLTSIAGLDSLTAFVGTEMGKVYSTTDGGNNWQLILSTGGSGFINDIKFSRTDPNVGYIFSDPPQGVGTAFKIYKTTNRGLDWIVYSPVFGGNYYGLATSSCVTDSSHAWFGLNCQPFFCGIAKIAHTTNGGLNWFTSSINGANYVWGMAFREDNQYGLCAPGDQQPTTKIYLTQDNGGSWSVIYNSMLTQPISSICYVNGTSVWYYCCPQMGSNINKSTDNGTTWYPMQDSSNDNLYYIDAVNQNDKIYAFCVTFQGSVLKLVDTVYAIGININSSRFPVTYILFQNYPNPFNPTTRIKFDIPPSKGARGMITKLDVYDALGREVAVLVNQHLTPGTYEFDFDGSNYSSGVYFYRLVAGDFTQTRKMVLLK